MHLSVKSWPDKPIVAAAENSSESTGSLQQYIYIFKFLNLRIYEYLDLDKCIAHQMQM